MALRYEFGNDYNNYRLIHGDMQHGYVSEWHRRNFLFVFANLNIADFYWLIAIMSFCYLIAFHLLIRQNLPANRYWFALLLLLINPSLFLIHLSAIRQAIAICIFILAVHLSQKDFRLFPTDKQIKYEKNFKGLKFIVNSEAFRIQNKSTAITFVYSNIISFVVYTSLIILASGMHTSAMILIPVYFMLNQKKVSGAFKVLLGLFIVIVLFTPLYRIIFDLGLIFFPQYEDYFGPGEGLTFGLGAIVNTLFFFLLIVLNINKLTEKEMVYGKLYLIATTFTFIARISPMLTRVGMYFDVFIIIVIPLVFAKMERGYLRSMTFAFMMLIYIARLRTFFTNPMWQSFWEYRMIFD